MKSVLLICLKVQIRTYEKFAQIKYYKYYEKSVRDAKNMCAAYLKIK